jgi:hypothetical protein
MAMDPDERYQSAGELGRALLGAVGEPAPPAPTPTVVPAADRPIPAPPSPTTPAGAQPVADASAPTPIHHPPRSWNPRLALVALAAIAVVVLGGLAIGGVFSGGDDSSSAGNSTPTTGAKSTGSPATSAGVSTDDAEAVVKRFGDRYRAEDLQGVRDTLTANAQFVFSSSRTGSVTKQGREQLGVEFSAVWAASDNYKLDVDGSHRTQNATIDGRAPRRPRDVRGRRLGRQAAHPQAQQQGGELVATRA